MSTPKPLSYSEEHYLRDTPSDCWTEIEEKLVWVTLDAARAERDAAEQETVRRICEWMRASHTPHAQADAIERGDWKRGTQ